MNKIKGILVDGQDAKIIEIEDKLEVYYEKLNCDMIEIVERKIGNNYYNIVCDEEFLCKSYDEPQHIAGMMIDDEGSVQELLLGSIFICNSDDEGNLTSLSDKDLETILKRIQTNDIIPGFCYGDIEICPSNLSLIY